MELLLERRILSSKKPRIRRLLFSNSRFRILEEIKLRSCLVVFSGGLDSTTLLYYVIQKLGYEKVFTITFDYGQKHRRELESALEISKQFGFFYQTKIVQINFDQLCESPLIGRNGVVPKATDNKQELTVIPARNSIFLALATAYAEANDIEDIFYAPTKDDFKSYPDCREEFVKAMSTALALGNKIRGVYAPFVNMSKAEVVKLGLELVVPFELTHTCYNNRRPACGVCDACVERINAFKANKIKDSLPYEIKINWREEK